MEMREYRQDAHSGPLSAWALLCVLSAVFLFAHAKRITDRVLRIEEIAAGAGLLVLGPAVLAVYLYRARHVRVEIDRPRGIVVSGRHLIPWQSILRVERRRPRLRRASGPAEMGKLADLGTGCLASGGELGALAVGFALLIAGFFVLWLLLMVVVPLLVVPLLEVFAPFGDRIRVVTAAGRPLVLRDLRDADEFMANLPARVPKVVR